MIDFQFGCLLARLQCQLSLWLLKLLTAPQSISSPCVSLPGPTGAAALGSPVLLASRTCSVSPCSCEQLSRTGAAQWIFQYFVLNIKFSKEPGKHCTYICGKWQQNGIGVGARCCFAWLLERSVLSSLNYLLLSCLDCIWNNCGPVLELFP